MDIFDILLDILLQPPQPFIGLFLTHGFLQDNPILLEEGCLSVNWDWIPGLYSQTNQMLMVSITDARWDKWGQPGGWTAWEPDTWFEHFCRHGQ